MAKIIERIHNVETGEIADVEREMTPDEVAIFENEKSFMAQEAIKIAEIEVKKEALLKKLGITEDEAKLLLS